MGHRASFWRVFGSSLPVKDDPARRPDRFQDKVLETPVNPRFLVQSISPESGSVCVVVEKTSGEIVNHHHPPQAQKLCSSNGDRLDDFKKIVLAKCKDPDGMLSIALDVIVERTRRSGINVTSPKYLEVALDRFNFHEGQDREDWTAASRGRLARKHE